MIGQGGQTTAVSEHQACEQGYYPIGYWAKLWGFSSKTVREWFRDEFGPGILRQPNTGRQSKRDYTTMMISRSPLRGFMQSDESW